MVSDFKRQVTGAILSEVGHGIPSDNVELDLQAGSVLVLATIGSLPSGVATEVHQGLNASAETLGRRVVASISSVRGVEVATTGVISASDIEIAAPGENLDGSGININLSLSELSPVLMCGFGGVALLGLCVYGIFALKSRRQHKVDPGRTEKEAMIPKAAAGKVHPTNSSRDNGSDSKQRDGARSPNARPQAAPDPVAGVASDRQAPPPASDARAVREFVITAADMGFNEDQARAALTEASGNTENALDLLLAEQ